MLLQMENVFFRYGKNLILDDINLHLMEKEILSIVGPNGSGKTTLLKIITGFLQPNSGRVSVLGKKPAELFSSGVIGYLPQIAVYKDKFPLTVLDVVSMSRYSKKRWFEILKSDDRDIIFQSLKKVEMDKFSNHHFGSLSGGQKQRVLIARALAVSPRILILDEPSTGLDTVSQDSFYRLLIELRDGENLSVIMVSHDIGSVSTFVDKIACLNKKIHFHGAPTDCPYSDKLEEIFGNNIQILHHHRNCATCGGHNE